MQLQPGRAVRTQTPQQMLAYGQGRDWSSGGRVGNAGSSICSEGQGPLKAVCQGEEGEEKASALFFFFLSSTALKTKLTDTTFLHIHQLQ